LLVSWVIWTHGGAASVHSLRESNESLVQGASLSAAFEQLDFSDLRLQLRPQDEIRRTLWILKLGKAPASSAPKVHFPRDVIDRDTEMKEAGNDSSF
jgi:hypothetical protein